MSSSIKTCEFVSPKHPDKLCDQIADALLDAYLTHDAKSRIALEVLGGHGVVTICGEVTSRATIIIENIVGDIVGSAITVEKRITQQSSEIARGVDTGGAGDQGIMVGYATAETESFMPKEYELARNVCKKIYSKYPFDGKVQVTMSGDEVTAVVASFQNTKSSDLEKLIRSIIAANEYLINPAGEWTCGGFDADSGATGRKIVIDNYGPQIPVGGGSFSGKDPTKVDRSAAYMARFIAVDLLKKKGARNVLVKLAYAIGKKEPVMAVADIDGKQESVKGYDLSPRNIIEFLNLAHPQYLETARWGHFGRGFRWG